MTENKKTPHNMRTFYTVWFGQLISTLGSGLTGFALSIWVYQQTQSVTMFALNMLAFMLPGIFFSPIAGALVDRWNRRWVMIMADTGAGLSSLVLVFLLLGGELAVWHVFILTFINALFSSFQWPAYSAATTMLVPQDQLDRAGGMNQIGQAISQLISPAVAGAIYVSWGMQGVIAIDVVTFLIAVGTLLVIHIPEPVRSTIVEKVAGEKPSLLEDIKFGFTYIWQRKGLFWLLMYLASFNFVFSLLGPLFTPMLLKLGTPDQVGYVSSAIGVGMLVGTIGVSVLGGVKNRVLGILGSGMWVFAALLGFFLEPTLLTVAVIGFLLMLGMPLGNASSQALWQSKTEPDVQGRVFSVRRMLAQFTAPIATILVGPLVDGYLAPAMMSGGSLANSFIGRIMGVGVGRGEALLFVSVGLVGILLSFIFYAIPSLRNVQQDLPDIEVKERVDEETATIATEPAPAD